MEGIEGYCSMCGKEIKRNDFWSLIQFLMTSYRLCASCTVKVEDFIKYSSNPVNKE